MGEGEEKRKKKEGKEKNKKGKDDLPYVVKIVFFHETFVPL